MIINTYFPQAIYVCKRLEKQLLFLLVLGTAGLQIQFSVFLLLIYKDSVYHMQVVHREKTETGEQTPGLLLQKSLTISLPKYTYLSPFLSHFKHIKQQVLSFFICCSCMNFRWPESPNLNLHCPNTSLDKDSPKHALHKEKELTFYSQFC